MNDSFIELSFATLEARLEQSSLRFLLQVTTSDSVHAEKMFGALGHVTTSQLSQSRLIRMLAKQKLVWAFVFY